MLKRIDQTGGSGTYGGSRKEMIPAQQPSPKPAKKLQEGLDWMNNLVKGKK